MQRVASAALRKVSLHSGARAGAYLGNPHGILSPVSYSSVNWAVATQAERDQIAFIIRTTVATKLFMVDFKVGHGTAQLTSPAISAQHLLSKILVILLLEPDRCLFRQNLLHWICSFTICRNAWR